jgi:hypothetical protein
MVMYTLKNDLSIIKEVYVYGMFLNNTFVDTIVSDEPLPPEEVRDKFLERWGVWLSDEGKDKMLVELMDTQLEVGYER